MSMPPGFEWIATLPPGLQMLVMLGVGIGFVFLGRSGYIAGKREPPVSGKDVVLQAASITDMSAVKDLATGVTRLALAQEKVAEETGRCADELGTIRQILAEDAEDRQDYRQWRKGFEAGQQRDPPPRRRT
jgi:hypothetical protein